MSNKIIVGIVLVVAVLGVIFFFTQKQSQNSPSPTQQTQVSSDTVTIKNFSFNPSTLTVKQGAAVVWVNQDAATHKIKSDAFNSADLNQGEKFEFTFNNKGSFEYSCAIHPSMRGTIVVE